MMSAQDIQKGLLRVCYFSAFFLSCLSPVWAGDSYGHFVNTPGASQEKLIETLGQPTSKVKKLGGWELWRYDQVTFKGQAVDNAWLKVLYFKSGNYVTPDTFFHQRHQQLRIWFFPFLLFNVLPWIVSLFFVILASGAGIWGVLRIPVPAKYFFLYILLGCFLSFIGYLI